MPSEWFMVASNRSSNQIAVRRNKNEAHQGLTNQKHLLPNYAFNTRRRVQLKKQDMNAKIIKLFLRIAIGIGFFSAVADRFGLWPAEISAWGNWERFLNYTQLINPLIPKMLIPTLGAIATTAELLFAVCLFIGFRTELVAKLSGYLMLIFALSIAFSTGIKGAFDYSVFAASAGAFALSTMKEKYWELDTLILKKNQDLN